MSADNVVQRKLEGLLRRLSPADRSVLAATLTTPDSQIATVRDTASETPTSR